MKSVLSKLLACVAWSAASMASLQAQELKEIRVLLPIERATTIYPLGVANELELFEEEGIKVTILSSETTVPYVAFLQNEEADIVMLDAAQIFQAAAAELPISVVYEAMQFAAEGIAVLAESSVQSVADLEGTTIGLASDRDLGTLKIALDTAGMTVDDVQTVVVGDAGPTMAIAFTDKTVAAVTASFNDWSIIEANNIDLRLITPKAVEDTPANSFVIFKNRAEELQPVLAGFLRAWAKGTLAGVMDKQVVAAMMRDWSPEEWEREEFGLALFDACLKLNSNKTELYGDVQPEIWKKVQAPMVRFGDITAEIDPGTFLDGSFIAEVNNFDRDELKAKIEAWRAANQDKIK